MIRDTPALTAIAPEAKAKNTGQTILKKQFSNGANLTLVGANSPGGLSAYYLSHYFNLSSG